MIGVPTPLPFYDFRRATLSRTHATTIQTMKKYIGHRGKPRTRNLTSGTKAARRPAFGLTKLPDGSLRVSAYVADKIIEAKPHHKEQFEFGHIPARGRTIRVCTWFSGDGSPLSRGVEPVALDLIIRWSTHQLNKLIAPKARRAEQAYRSAQDNLKSLVGDYGFRGPIRKRNKDACTAFEQSMAVRQVEASMPPLAFIGQEMILQGIIV